jgi:hypothetical protein
LPPALAVFDGEQCRQALTGLHLIPGGIHKRKITLLQVEHCGISRTAYP